MHAYRYYASFPAVVAERPESSESAVRCLARRLTSGGRVVVVDAARSRSVARLCFLLLRADWCTCPAQCTLTVSKATRICPRATRCGPSKPHSGRPASLVPLTLLPRSMNTAARPPDYEACM